MDTVPHSASDDNPYTVYALIDPRDYAVCYIGITNNVYDRFAQHLRCDGTNPAKDTWIAELKQENVMLIMKTLEVVATVEQARERETFWIHHYRFLGTPLFNQAVPSIRLPKRVTQPVLIRVYDRGAKPNAGRKSNNDKIKETILYYHIHRAWPKDLSRNMCSWYKLMYFTEPSEGIRIRGKTPEQHARAYERGREWIAEYEDAKAAQEGA